MFEKLTAEQYNDLLASKAPTPGGGSALAMIGATACSLVEMAINVTTAKLDANDETCAYLNSELKLIERARTALYRLSNDDSTAFQQIIASLKLPKSTHGEAKERETALQKAYHSAALVPLDVMRICSDLLARSELRVLPHLSKYVSSDCVIAIDLFKTIISNSKHNVYTNTCRITSPDLKALLERQCEEILKQL